jgi:cadmium resistance protein CadD (predicted permease)
MKKINIVSLVFFVIGAIIALISQLIFSSDPLGSFLYLWSGYFFIFVAIIIFIIGLFIKSQNPN